MFDFLKRIFSRERSEESADPWPPAQRQSPLPKPAKPAAASENPGQPELVQIDPDDENQIETVGPGKNVLIRNKYVREETGTYETLKIVDDSLVDSGEETGIDPYNTGDFDRSKNWDKRFR